MVERQTRPQNPAVSCRVLDEKFCASERQKCRSSSNRIRRTGGLRSLYRMLGESRLSAKKALSTYQPSCSGSGQDCLWEARYVVVRAESGAGAVSSSAKDSWLRAKAVEGSRAGFRVT